MAGDKGSKVSTKKADKKADKKGDKKVDKKVDKKAAATQVIAKPPAPKAKAGVPALSKDILAYAAKVCCLSLG